MIKIIEWKLKNRHSEKRGVLMTNIEEKLRSLKIFDSCSVKDFKELALHFEMIYLKNKEILFKENAPIDTIYIIFYGSIKIQKTLLHADPIIFNFLGPGQFLGVAIAEVNKPTYPATGLANEDSAVLACSTKFYFDVLLRMTAIREIIHKQIRERFLEFQNDRCMENVLVSQRLADLLLRLWERQKMEMGLQIMIPITRKDIAQRLGIQPATVIRILSQWTKKGWIKTSNKRIAIENYAKLRELKDEHTHKKIKGSTSVDSGTVE